MDNERESWAPRGRAASYDGAVPDDPGPWLSERSPIDLGAVSGGSRDVVAASVEDSAVEATVRWFRTERGYGFVELPEGRGDAFLHLNALRPVGRESLPTGAKLRVIVGLGPKGAQVTRVVEVDASSIVESSVRSFAAGARTQGRRAPDASAAVDLTGRVKWFDGVRGFGFVASDDFGKDVFVHCSILRPTGVLRLAEGQAVAMRVVDTPKGREAIEISL